MLAAVVFDLDGVLLDSEQLWDAARRQVVADNGGEWRTGATEAMQGMSSTEWAAYLHDTLGVRLDPTEIAAAVVARVLAEYRRALPLLPGASEAVQRLGERFPLALASSANRPVIEAVLDAAGWRGRFQATVSSEEVAHGKPAPDVYITTARLLGVPPSQCVAVEDSANGIRSAYHAGMRVVAVPNTRYPPEADALALAALVVPSLNRLTAEVLAAL